MILELHFLLGRELAVLFAVVVVGRLLDRGALRIECGAPLDNQQRRQYEQREHQSHFNRVAHQRILAGHWSSSWYEYERAPIWLLTIRKARIPGRVEPASCHRAAPRA